MNLASTPSQGRSQRTQSHSAAPQRSGQLVALVLSWTAVGLPLAWGVLETLRKALALFQ